MIEFVCSICDKELTQVAMINGTVMCRDCLKKVAQETKKNEESLIHNMAEQIITKNSMRDLYD